MLDIIKAKINEYNNCDLTIEELKVLYIMILLKYLVRNM